VPAHGQQTTPDHDGREDTPALSTLANPRRVRWSTHAGTRRTASGQEAEAR
jgi:hypothetical protein